MVLVIVIVIGLYQQVPELLLCRISDLGRPGLQHGTPGKSINTFVIVAAINAGFLKLGVPFWGSQ